MGRNLVCCDAPGPSLVGTISVSPKNASRGSTAVSSWSSLDGGRSTGAVGGGAPRSGAEFCERTQQPMRNVGVVGEGQGGQDAAVIGHGRRRCGKVRASQSAV